MVKINQILYLLPPLLNYIHGFLSTAVLIRTIRLKNCKNFIHNGNHILFVTQIYLPTFWGLG